MQSPAPPRATCLPVVAPQRGCKYVTDTPARARSSLHKDLTRSAGSMHARASGASGLVSLGKVTTSATASQWPPSFLQLKSRLFTPTAEKGDAGASTAEPCGVRACVCARARACACACVRACVRACDICACGPAAAVPAAKSRAPSLTSSTVSVQPLSADQARKVSVADAPRRARHAHMWAGTPGSARRTPMSLDEILKSEKGEAGASTVMDAHACDTDKAAISPGAPRTPGS